MFAKLAYQAGADSITTLGLRMVFSMPMYIWIAISIKPLKKEEVTRKEYLWLLFFGLIGYYIASFLDFKGLEYIKASLERLILFIYPTLVLIMGYIFFGERISKAQLLGVLTTYLGIVIVFIPELGIQKSNEVVTGAVLIFLSALTYGGYLVGSGWLIPKFGAKRFTTYAMMISTVAVFSHFLIENQGFGLIFDQNAKVYIYTIAMAIFSTVVPSYLISYSIKGLGSGQFAIFASLGPISTIVLAYLFLSERLNLIQLIGGIIVISGVFTAEKFRKRRKKIN